MTTWRNRITRYTEEDPGQLLANPSNWRTHPGSQADALRGVMADVGIVQNVIANERTGYLVDGHLRVMEALKAGQPTIPVTWVDLSPEEEALILATLDPLSAMAGVDSAALDALLRDVATDSPAVAAMLDALAQEAGIVPGVEAGGGGDEFDATPEEGPTRCGLGDLWIIGGVHRLIIGDSTDPATVARLMGGERAGAVITDPPYGIEYVTNHRTWRTHIARPIANDDMVPTKALERIYSYLDDGAAVYWFTTEREIETFYIVAEQLGLSAKRCLVWDKGNWAAGDLEGDWGVQTEYIPWAAKGRHLLREGRPANLLAYRRQVAANRIVDHPTEKPVDLIQKIILHSTNHGDIVIDMFLGSGTTMVAGIRLGRRIYGCEIEPRYGDVILRRAEAEGLTVERAE